MANSRLIHDAAWATATVLVETVENLLRPEEKIDAHREFYKIVRAGMEALNQQTEVEDRRLLRRSNSKN